MALKDVYGHVSSESLLVYTDHNLIVVVNSMSGCEKLGVKNGSNQGQESAMADVLSWSYFFSFLFPYFLLFW